MSKPLFAAPAIAVELDDFLHEVPSPGNITGRLDGINLRSERREVSSLAANSRGRKDRLLAVDFFHDGAGSSIEDIVVAGSRSDVQIFADHRGRGDVVAVAGTPFCLEGP